MAVRENVGDVQQTSLSTWKWTIKNYSSYLAASKEAVTSANFAIVHSGVTTNWHFQIYPNGDKECKDDVFSAFLANVDESDVTASFRIGILNKNNQVVFITPASPQVTFGKDREILGRSKFVNHEFLNDKFYRALTDDTLMLQYEILIDEELTDVEDIDAKRLKDDFEKLLDSDKYSDVTFVIGQEKMYLHKAILAKRSPVFEAMFEHDMKENRQSTVEITVVELKVMREMFRYIYAGKVKEISDISRDLLIAADKYCIEELKIVCEITICSQLNNDNVLEYLRLAKRYNARLLKPKCYEFVTTHIKDIHPKPEFKHLDTEIMDEIIGILISPKAAK